MDAGSGTVWWHELVAPILAAATAIIAAAIAARTANARQAEQLAHDRELQASELAYDRKQRNRQHVRDTVDAAVASFDAAVQTITRYGEKVRGEDVYRDRLRHSMGDETLDDQRRSDAEEGVAEERQKLSALSEAVSSVRVELASNALRLALRLGREHAIVGAYQAYGEALGVQHDVIRRYDREALLGDDDEAKMEEADEASRAAGGRFLASCEKWFEEG